MVRLTDRPDMTLGVYCGRKTTTTTHCTQPSIIIRPASVEKDVHVKVQVIHPSILVTQLTHLKITSCHFALGFPGCSVQYWNF